MKITGYQDNPYYGLLILLLINSELVSYYLEREDKKEPTDNRAILEKFPHFKKLNENAQKEIIAIAKAVRAVFDLSQQEPLKYYSALHPILNNSMFDKIDFPSLFDLAAYKIKYQINEKNLVENYQRKISHDIIRRLDNVENSYLFYRKKNHIPLINNFLDRIGGTTALVLYFNLLTESVIAEDLTDIDKLWKAEKIKPIHFAAAMGDNKLINIFFSAESENLIAYGFSPIQYACTYNPNENVIFNLIKKGVKLDFSRKNYSLFYLAAASGKYNVMTYFLNKNIKKSVDDKNSSDKWTALHVASNNGHIECVQLLLEKNANPLLFTGDVSKQLPVHLACKHNHQEIVLMFLKLFPKQINISDGSGRTLLHYACANGNLELVNFLLNNEAAPLVISKTNQTAMQLIPSSDENIKDEFKKKIPRLDIYQTRLDSTITFVKYVTNLGIPGLVFLILFCIIFSTLLPWLGSLSAVMISLGIAGGSAIVARYVARKYLPNYLTNYLLMKMVQTSSAANEENSKDAAIDEKENSYGKIVLEMNIKIEKEDLQEHSIEIKQLQYLQEDSIRFDNLITEQSHDADEEKIPVEFEAFELNNVKF